MLHRILIAVLIIMLRVVPAIAQDTPKAPPPAQEPNRDELEIIAVMEILQNMDMVEAMEIMEDLDVLIKEDSDDDKND